MPRPKTAGFLVAKSIIFDIIKVSCGLVCAYCATPKPIGWFGVRLLRKEE
jgi:hypothetical protein